MPTFNEEEKEQETEKKLISHLIFKIYNNILYNQRLDHIDVNLLFHFYKDRIHILNFNKDTQIKYNEIINHFKNQYSNLNI